ncbi:uncharacterized protein [Dermacentor albipictus]|uniref:uncharacterized protein isoform X1 n=1 Tax=Dermacentor albipictus TaxID=60249 RepID=UPI0031FC238A
MRTEVFEPDILERERLPPRLAPRRRRFIRFLLPRLYNRRYGQDLEWIDQEEGTFRIRWSQDQGISQRDPPVQFFKDWAVLKRIWNEADPKNLDKAKDRVRVALLNIRYVKQIKSEHKNYRCFRIENQQLLDDTKRRLRLRQQMRDGILSHVKFCAIHKTAYAPCCCKCCSWRTPPVPIFPDQKEGDITYICDQFEFFCTQVYPHVQCWYRMDDYGNLQLTSTDHPSFI